VVSGQALAVAGSAAAAVILVLGVQNESTASGAQLLQWTDNGTPDHLWTLTAS